MPTNIPGLKSGHQMITPACRANRGVKEAFLEAATRLYERYAEYAEAEGNEQVTWHVVLTRDEERPNAE